MASSMYVGLGSNLGDREALLARALAGLARRGVHVRRVSSVYESEPVGPVREQPAFYNAVAEVETELSPRAALRACLDVEQELGRERRVPQGPRNIDLDLLLADDLVACWPELQLPHPALTLRAFVLRPLLELRPDLADPRDGTLLATHLARVESTQVLRRLNDVAIAAPARAPATRVV